MMLENGTSENNRTAISVLVVDNHDSDFKTIEQLLNEAFEGDIEIDRVGGGQQADAAIRLNAHQVYIVNQELGALSGVELIGKHQIISDDRPFILVTSQEDYPLYQTASEIGATDFLVRSELTAHSLHRSIRIGLMMIKRQRELRSQATDLQSALARAERREKRYRELAQRDPLTNLANRTRFKSELKTALEQGERAGKETALLLLDLDRFKTINDTHGHQIGDEVLKTCANRLADVVRRTDVVARLGGDEFAIVATNLDGPDGAVRIAEKVIKAIAQPIGLAPTTSSERAASISTATSIGIALTNGRWWHSEQMINQADAALYRAKDQGRGLWYCYDQRLDRELRLAKSVEADLQDALRGDQLSIEYQPKVIAGENSDVSLAGVEALLRWRHPTYGWVPPNEFIKIAEAGGQMIA
ncbi:MAG: diguanylate cyclase, partial [Pseudomonadota bacterium]